MKPSKNFKVLARALVVVSAAVIVVSGVTFAALQSQQDTLAGNTIETATANLQLSVDGYSFTNSHAGFDFSNLIPGGQAQPVTGYTVYLKNAGGTALSLKLALTSVPANPNNVDLSKVNVLLTTVGSGTGAQSFSLQALMTASTTGGLDITSGNLASGATQQYKLQIAMASDAISGSSASLANIDFAFSGLAQSS
jgi:hypothetical protein